MATVISTRDAEFMAQQLGVTRDKLAMALMDVHVSVSTSGNTDWDNSISSGRKLRPSLRPWKSPPIRSDGSWRAAAALDGVSTRVHGLVASRGLRWQVRQTRPSDHGGAARSKAGSKASCCSGPHLPATACCREGSIPYAKTTTSLRSGAAHCGTLHRAARFVVRRSIQLSYGRAAGRWAT